MNIDTGELKSISELNTKDLLRNGGKYIPVQENWLSKKEIEEKYVKADKVYLIKKLVDLRDLRRKLTNKKGLNKLKRKIEKLEKKIERIK